MKFIPVFISFFLYCPTFCQDVERKTYDYLTVSDRWKLIIDNDSLFKLTTNTIFRPDTLEVVTSTLERIGNTISFIVDSGKAKDKFLLKAKISNEQVIAQGGTFDTFEDYILFKNVYRGMYDTLEFSKSKVGTFYRGDGVWSNLITLNADSTYEIVESVHGTKEHVETGTWRNEGGLLIFQPAGEDNTWIDRYSTNRMFYLTDDFLIGRLEGKGGISYLYFCRLPIGL